MTAEVLTLQTALSEGRIEEFVAQQEARGIGPIDRAEFDVAVTKVIKARQSKDRTSRSASGGNSNGTKTRRGSGQVKVLLTDMDMRAVH